ncbi:hypothetical protein E2C01_076618 [Portunus trituberculatus]|uniref:Uncharacterized protein n=1 Tax=Portunus trituberculatus TaxID=210409 RepID=A0A5B7IJ50_PORTR|nr:hypothetical protein [Portunus trituberculatus]
MLMFYSHIPPHVAGGGEDLPRGQSGVKKETLAAFFAGNLCFKVKKQERNACIAQWRLPFPLSWLCVGHRGEHRDAEKSEEEVTEERKGSEGGELLLASSFRREK